MKSRAREQASSSIPLRGRHERGAEKNGKQMRSQVASRSENHDGKQQDRTTHEQNAKSDRQTRPEPAHNSHKSKTNDTPRPPRVRPRGQERERKKWSIWYYVVQFSSVHQARPVNMALALYMRDILSPDLFNAWWYHYVLGIDITEEIQGATRILYAEFEKVLSTADLRSGNGFCVPFFRDLQF